MKSTDQNFIKRLQRQKEDALEFIVDAYLPVIKGITYKVLSPLGNEGLIDECVNDIFLAIWNHSKKFQGNSSDDFKKWICAIAKYKAIDYYRKASKKVEYTTEFLEAKLENSAEDELVLMEDKEELIQLINLLEPIDRSIFIMKYFLGLKTDEIAAKLQLTSSSIDNRIYRGKKKLYKKALNLNIGGSLV
ncbi:sigma-70 family RNA polymerase sigma factor [Metabacillus litoralis]|uniref:Sigma-70 family RNA polymerase sigma factor n=1 Tax=Metabacillus litoralis TaxID=152268 RepID=A0A5C6VJL3_9BACI|nr:sigma-70 family RNA polymerase sigma factor [Metabacillus litoralis]TXC85772.1 sigma-70 family RNA polymerase sigma factor [Metabacillus litoralis]